MTTDEDMDKTFHDISTAGFQVVRTWAFNDVAQIPASGTYFQIVEGCNTTINYGPDGLQRLDRVVATADRYGLKLLLTLTNNWGAELNEPASSLRARQDDSSLPRSYLSNDYGGMDRYNRAYIAEPSHDDFYTKPSILSAFKNYIANVVPRYANSSAVLGWELANDPRCSSTLPGSSTCNTTIITKWVADISGYIKSLDSNHLITAGDGGFYCTNCTKIYAASSSNQTDSPGGPTFDGSYGVDTEDIISIPSIDFGSFQLFPNQVHYFPGDNGDFATTSILQGSRWIIRHSDTASTFRKPEALTAFAVVTKDNWRSFVPFNSTVRMPESAPCAGVDDSQQNYGFMAWTGASLGGNVFGTLEYQWQQKGLVSFPIPGRRRQDTSGSPQDGSAHYQDPYTAQNAAQTVASIGAPV